MNVSKTDLKDMEKRILDSFSVKFEAHEQTEMIIAKNMQKVLDRHDVILVGEKGTNGIAGDVKEFKAKIRVWTGIFTVLTGSGIITVVYAIFVN